MSGMLDRVNDFITSTVGNVPLAILTIALLATPTIIYIIYRLSNPSGVSHGRSQSSSVPAALWVCPVCRSVNDLTSGRCYRCDYRVDDASDVMVIDSVTAKPIVLPGPAEPFIVDRPGVPVGPGVQPATAAPATPVPVAPTAPAAPAAVPVTAEPASPGVPVGPGQPNRVPAGPLAARMGGVGAAVGARRPFDPVPEPRPTGAATGPVETPEPPEA
jgi:hypothetical protein